MVPSANAAYAPIFNRYKKSNQNSTKPMLFSLHEKRGFPMGIASDMYEQTCRKLQDCSYLPEVVLMGEPPFS